MDYKATIIKGIQEIQKTAGSEEVIGQWQELIDIVNRTKEESKLALMYETLKEEICKAMGVPVEAFKVKSPSGVEVFNNMDEYLKKAKK